MNRIAKVFDANVYVNERSQHGLASEVAIPDISALMSDYKAMGMIGTREFFNGFDKMESTIKWTYPDNDVAKAMVNPMKSVDLMVRSSKAEYTDGDLTNEAPIVIYMNGLPKKHTSGSHKAKEDTEVEDTISVNYLKIEIDGEEIVELDVTNNIFKIGGEDQLAQRRENLGI